MTRLRDIAKGKFADVMTLIVVLVFGIGLSFLFYTGQRNIAIDVGAFGDSPYVSNFYADEPDVNYRYRWTKAHSDVQFTGAGSALPDQVQIRAQGPPSSVYSGTISSRLSINGVALQPEVVTLAGQLRDYVFTVANPGKAGAGALRAPYTLSIDSSTFRPAGDARTLGIKLDEVVLRQSSSGANMPPLDLLGWWIVFLTGLTLVLTPVRQWYKLALALALTFGTAVIFFHNVLFAGAYLPVATVILVLAGLMVWQRHHLPHWPFAAEPVRERPRFATWVMLAAMAVVAALAIWAIPQVQWIGHADYAENANIARNFVEGRGLSVDYVAQFYKSYPGITHPAETWPLLQPLLIAPFFALFGPETWVSKLPNLLLLLTLAWGVFLLASRLWDARAGLFAGVLTLVHPYFFNTALYPINDLAFTAIFFALAWLVWRAQYPRERDYDGGTSRDIEPAPSAATGRRIPFVFRPSAFVLQQSAIAIGALAALLIWSKPSGVPLLAGLAIWGLVRWWGAFRNERSTLPVRPLALMAGGFAVVLLPLLVRNVFALGTIYFSTEGVDAWILRYWPFIDWENIYKVYVGAPDFPHPRWIAGGKFGYQNLIDAVAINFRWVWERGVMSGVTGSDFVIGPVPLLGAFVGLIAITRRAAALFGMVILSLVMYGLFILLYWHFEGRYFQVAVPWLYMLLAWGVVWAWDRLRSFVPGGQSQWLGWLVPSVALVLFMWPGVDQMHNHLVYDTRPTSFTVAMDWLSKNSTASDVVMTRDPWELNWYTRRKAVMIPFDDLATIERTAKEYGVTMLQLGGPGDSPDNFDNCPADPNSARFPTGSRPALGKLYCGFDIPGFTRVYQNNDLIIYRLTG